MATPLLPYCSVGRVPSSVPARYPVRARRDRTPGLPCGLAIRRRVLPLLSGEVRAPRCGDGLDMLRTNDRLSQALLVHHNTPLLLAECG